MPSPPTSPTPDRSRSLLLLGAAVLLLLVGWRSWLCDDAFITFRTVDNALGGYGLRWNTAERVQTYTHPLWMLLLLAVSGLTGDPAWSAYLLSWALLGGLLFALHRAAGRNTAASLAGMAVLAGSRSFVDFATSGLENPLTHGLLAGAVLALRQGAWRWVLTLSGALLLVRHDLLLLALPLSGAALACARQEERSRPGSGVRSKVSVSPFFALTPQPPLPLGEGEKRRNDRYLGATLPAGEGCAGGGGEGLIGNPIRLDLTPIPRPAEVLRVAAIALTPLLLWSLFACFYYGSALPNTAYAKLNLGIPQAELLAAGGYYLAVSLLSDPLSALALAAGLLWCWRGAGWAGLGTLLYLGYVLWVGGDYLAGRFLSPLVLLSALVLSERVRTARRPSSAALLLGVLVLAAASHGLAPQMRKLATAQLAGLWGGLGLPVRPVEDQQPLFAPFTSPQVLLKQGGAVRHIWALHGRKVRLSPEKFLLSEAVGLAGYYAGPSVHVLDPLALGDPLLSRLPALAREDWKPGHYLRALPAYYTESLRSGMNLLPDPAERAAYERLRLITRAPLFSPYRLRALPSFLWQGLGEGFDRQAYRRPYESRVEHSRLPGAQEGFFPWNQRNNVLLGAEGVEVSLGQTVRAARLSIDLGPLESYTVGLLRGGELLWEAQLSPKPLWFMGREVLVLPVEVAASGFDALRVRGSGEVEGKPSLGAVQWE